MRFSTLDDWLRWQETLHPSEIELGLERVGSVFKRLWPQSPPFAVITVAGTNGKGSSVAMLAAILRAAGYRVASYTSPHLLRYNERIRINDHTVDDATLIEAFARIDQARQSLSLTYFEFGTLAALDIFYRCHGEEGLDVALLEVGLGGRLDAVNIVDADVALITSISLDHTDWLGETRDAIGMEKAGILRAGRAAVFSGPDMPSTIRQHASDLGVSLYVAGEDFDFDACEQDWQWRTRSQAPVALPLPALRGTHQLQNAAGVLMALQLLQQRLPVSRQAIRQGLLAVELAGRFQVRPGQPQWIFDVAHNPDAVAQLAARLQQDPCAGQTLVVVGMLRDKDATLALQSLAPLVAAWFVAALPHAGERAMSPQGLLNVIQGLAGGRQPASVHADVASACNAARAVAQNADRIVVCGSFHTVADALQADIY